MHYASPTAASSASRASASAGAAADAPWLGLLAISLSSSSKRALAFSPSSAESARSFARLSVPEGSRAATLDAEELATALHVCMLRAADAQAAHRGVAQLLEPVM